MLAEKKILGFIDMIASAAPTPGGGSAAALISSLGCALISMVCRLTIRKKGYENTAKETEMLSVSEKARKRLSQLIDEDANAFENVMRAYKMHAKTEKQKAERHDEIQKNLKKALLPPLEVMRLSNSVLKQCRRIADICNPNAISDAACACIALDAGLGCAYFNVKINLSHIKDRRYAEKISAEIEMLVKGSASLTRNALRAAEAKITHE